MKSPVIIIPGIQGTKLANVNKKNFDTVWSGLRKFFDNLYDILLDEDGETDKKKEVIIERQDVEDLAYSEIINYLKHRGYPVYIFGYDWRKSNMESGKELYQFVKTVRKKHPEERKINFLTHSMGCLVFSGFYKKLSVGERDEFVNKVLFTVPPFLGSVEALYNLVIGKSKLFNSSDDFRKIARTFPAVFELCPVYPNAIEFEDGQNFDIFNYLHWQHDPTRSDFEMIKRQYEQRIASLKQSRSDNLFLFDFSVLPQSLRDRMLVVAGIGEETQRRVLVSTTSEKPKNQFIFSDSSSCQDGFGDGTVHLESASAFKESITTISIKSRWIEKRLDGRMVMADWHSFFLNNGRVQNIIKRFLEKDLADLEENPFWYQSIGGGVERIS